MRTLLEVIKLNKSNIDKIKIGEPDFIDLGLPSGTLWAKCNVGAKEPEEYGDYFEFDDAQKYNCPTEEQFDELIDECKWELKKNNGIDGYTVTGKNGNSIFLPAAGFRYISDFYGGGSHGRYWSNARRSTHPLDRYSLGLIFNHKEVSVSLLLQSSDCKHSVRPVR